MAIKLPNIKLPKIEGLQIKGPGIERATTINIKIESQTETVIGKPGERIGITVPGGRIEAE